MLRQQNYRKVEKLFFHDTYFLEKKGSNSAPEASIAFRSVLRIVYPLLPATNKQVQVLARFFATRINLDWNEDRSVILWYLLSYRCCYLLALCLPLINVSNFIVVLIVLFELFPIKSLQNGTCLGIVIQ